MPSSPFFAPKMESIMLDAVFLIGGFALFAIGIAYTYACDRL
ncbi:MAG TPA: hypothetical protein VK779_03655 [Rhizomicrobium sp.]|nr:hypothetical protein [Rhizomicrobium sp.]